MGPRTFVGKFWWESCRYPDGNAPVVQRVINVESGFPWRTGVGIIVRNPFGTGAVAVGGWTGRAPQDVDEDGPVLKFREIDR